MSFFCWTQRKIFWILWEKEQFWDIIDFHSIFFCPFLEVNGAPKQPGYKLSSKYLSLCSAEQRHSYRFGTTRGWVNDRIFLCGWTIPVITHHFILILIELDPGWFWENTVAVVTELVCIWLTETARSYISVDFYLMDISANIYIFKFNWTTLI